jgi:5'-nucleotidase
MERRKFIENSLLLTGTFALSGINNSILAMPKEKKITILHTNDMHSRIDPFTSGKYTNIGGMARRATLIKKIREKEPNILLLDSGDVFQGTPYFNFFGGEIEYKLMSQMGYDASTLGNHDFDNGISGLEKMLPFAEFPILNANYDFKNNSLKNRFKPYKIFTKDEIKVGVFGIGIELNGLVSEKMHDKTIYNDPIETAKQMVQELKTKKCDLIICLSHLGYKYNEKKISDIDLANAVSGIDLILGGHTHTFLDKPVSITNKDGFTTLIGQDGWAGINLGKIDFVFTSSKTVKKVEGSSFLIDNSFETKV